jgi:hypothetical protein
VQGGDQVSLYFLFISVEHCDEEEGFEGDDQGLFIVRASLINAAKVGDMPE